MTILKPGDGIGLISPAGHIKKSDIQTGIDLLEKQGFKLKFGKNLFNKYRYFSGRVQDRLDDIHTFLKDPDVQALFAVRGGMGSTQLLEYLDFELWKKHQKLLIGFSDITALQWSIWSKSQISSFSGMALTLQLKPDNPYYQMFFKQIQGKKNSYMLSDFSTEKIIVANEGTAEGVILGGTLSMIINLLGTPFFPKLEKMILYLEDINEPLYKLERALIQLKNAGVLSIVEGLILGKFKNNNHTLKVWKPLKYLFPENIPVVFNFPYGHLQNSCALPQGTMAKLETNPFKLEWTI